MSRSGTAREGDELAPVFALDPAVLDGVGPSVAAAGVLIGADTDGRPLALTLSRAAPTRVVLLGGLYLARQIALRAVATGTRVVVLTGRPSTWEPVVRAGGGETAADPGTSAVTVLREPPRDLPRTAPLLVVHDRGATARVPEVARVPWRTTLTVLPTLVPAVSDVADDADLVLLQRLPPAESELAGRLWRLTPAMTETLRTLPDHGVVVLGRNLWRRADLVTGPKETAILGPVRRGD